LNGPPSGVRVVSTLAILPAMTSIRRRLAVSPDALASIEVKMEFVSGKELVVIFVALSPK
jgi:hypothetical protein